MHKAKQKGGLGKIIFSRYAHSQKKAVGLRQNNVLSCKSHPIQSFPLATN
jgi:hypothetical protein